MNGNSEMNGNVTTLSKHGLDRLHHSAGGKQLEDLCPENTYGVEEWAPVTPTLGSDFIAEEHGKHPNRRRLLVFEWKTSLRPFMYSTHGDIDSFT